MIRPAAAVAVALCVLGLAAQPAAADTNSDLAQAQQRAAVIMQVRAQRSHRAKPCNTYATNGSASRSQRAWHFGCKVHCGDRGD